MAQAHGIRRRAFEAWRAFGFAVGVGTLAGAAACNNNTGPTNVILPTSVGLVTTFTDSTFNFATLQTFAMPDTVVHLFPLKGTPVSVSRMFDQATLDEVKQNLLNRGYTQVENPSATKPDFVVLVDATASDNYNAWAGYPWFSFWGFYSGWDFFMPRFTTAWGIVYPWFGLIGTTAYSRGSLIVDLIPTSRINATQKTITSAWAGLSTGALSGGGNQTAITRGIDEMFALSPYLAARSLATPSLSTPPPAP